MNPLAGGQQDQGCGPASGYLTMGTEVKLTGYYRARSKGPG